MGDPSARNQRSSRVLEIEYDVPQASNHTQLAAPAAQINTGSKANLGWHALRGQVFCKLHVECRPHSTAAALTCGNELCFPLQGIWPEAIERENVVVVVVSIYIYIFYLRVLFLLV